MSTRILIAYTNAGGGHLSASLALQEALRDAHGDAVEVAVLDLLQERGPWPFNRLETWYPALVRNTRVWHAIYRLTDSRSATALLRAVSVPLARRRVARHLARARPDIVVSANSLVVQAIRMVPRAPHERRATLVTDLVTTHASWYDSSVDLCLVPTEAARDRAVALGTPSGHVAIVGLPISLAFSDRHVDREHTRARLGWTSGRPVVLLVGGGEGMGPVAAIVETIARSGLSVELAVVAGRNQSLAERLSARRWPLPVHVYGFVTEMPAFMRAADVLVTKAGPSTICEGLASGLPMVLYDRLPGQEDGNVALVVESGAGVWAPSPDLVNARLHEWLGWTPGRPAFERARTAALAAARPEAAREAAAAVWSLVRERGTALTRHGRPPPPSGTSSIPD